MAPKVASTHGDRILRKVEGVRETHGSANAMLRNVIQVLSDIVPCVSEPLVNKGDIAEPTPELMNRIEFQLDLCHASGDDILANVKTISQMVDSIWQVRIPEATGAGGASY